jgi:hypothetical protein
MKLFKIDSPPANVKYSQDAIFVVGKRWDSGVYFLFNSPFVQERTYIDHNTFHTKIGPCRRRFMMWCGKYGFNTIHTFTPTYDE